MNGSKRLKLNVIIVNSLWILLLALVISAVVMSCSAEEEAPAAAPPTVELPDVAVYVTHYDETSKLGVVEDAVFVQVADPASDIVINTAEVYQEMDGFGFALTGSSAYHINSMSIAAQVELLSELFGTGTDDIGISYLRITVGASDLDLKVFSYNDNPSEGTDIDQSEFSIEQDEINLIPVLNRILSINPDIKIMASPWSAPAWMKSNNSAIGGKLATEYYDSYALYLAKYVEAMAGQGITIEALSVQNEPLHEGNNPSMGMSAAEQTNFVKNSLGPIFEERGITTKIILYDHNADRTDYPIEILNDTEAKKYVDGSGFHLYGGAISDLSQVHNAHPDKNLYFTEQWYGAPGDFGEDLNWHTQEILIGATRNWCKTVIEWNLSSNPEYEPHTNGGCTECLGAIVIDGDQVVRNAGYYVIGHLSKFVRPGAHRVSSTNSGDISNVAFLTADNQVVLLAINNSTDRKSFNITQSEEAFSITLDGGAVATIIWDHNL